LCELIPSSSLLPRGKEGNTDSDIEESVYLIKIRKKITTTENCHTEKGEGVSGKKKKIDREKKKTTSNLGERI